jgi:hypothetical protein
MDRYNKIIDKQIGSSKDKNLFYKGINATYGFIYDTVEAIKDFPDFEVNEEAQLIEYATEKAIQECCRVNQYFYFNNEAVQQLKMVYQELFSMLKRKELSIKEIEKMHWANLNHWLKKTNSFAEKIYSTKEEKVELVACSQYTPELQMNILQVDISAIAQPVLDIGCGDDAFLVKKLRNSGFDAYGFDRNVQKEEYLFKTDWFQFDFGVKKWGSIISHLAFSNHFHHHHLREDGQFIAYAKKYMEILHSLKSGGSFYYTPDLPYIEQYLDADLYSVNYRIVEGFDFKAVIVKRLN